MERVWLLYLGVALGSSPPIPSAPLTSLYYSGLTPHRTLSPAWFIRGSASGLWVSPCPAGRGDGPSQKADASLPTCSNFSEIRRMFQPGFLYPDTADIWSRAILCCGVCAAHCRVSSTPCLCTHLRGSQTSPDVPLVQSYPD